MAALNGSSPLARGTRVLGRRRRGPRRFIPARAGNTRSPRTRTARIPVHPRSRGEHNANGTTVLEADGSSPLARGTRLRPPQAAPVSRFIPARAGNTPPVPLRSGGAAVHPRSRGEHPTRPSPLRRCCGSSPLARGTPIRHRRRSAPRRFIPARAGNTGSRSSSLAHRPVHPRSRGEHAARLVRRARTDGSSPLARGTLFPETTDKPHLF